MMTREELTEQAKAAMEQDIQRSLQGLRKGLRDEMATQRGKTDLISLLTPRSGRI